MACCVRVYVLIKAIVWAIKVRIYAAVQQKLGKTLIVGA